MLTYDTPELRARFNAKWAIDLTHGCWIWLASKDRDGYGWFGIDGNKHAHRVSWELHHGRALWSGEWVLHNCPGGDNPSCVNPAHLWIGTAADNSRDAVLKGRMARGDRSRVRRYPETVPRGEQCNLARLTATQVLDIRARYATGERQIPLAAAFGVTQAAVSAIVTRKNWKHL